MAQNGKNQFLTSGINRRTLLKSVAGAGLITGFPGLVSSVGAASALDGKTIGFSMTHSSNDWLVQMRAGVVNAGQAMGAKVSVLDAGDNPAKQITDLETLAVRGVDVVLISTFYAEAIAPGVKALNDAGIPVVVLSSSLKGGVTWDALLTTDTAGTAKSAGQYFLDKLGNRGNVVQMEGKPGSLINQARGKGWRRVIEESPAVQVVGHAIAHYQKGQALRAMEDILQREPKIDAVYCHNDGMALGVIQAAQEAGRLDEMFITGYDGMRDDALKAIHDGQLAGTWEYLPFGVEAVDVAARLLDGKKVPKRLEFPSPFISKDNILNYYDPATGKRKTAPSALSSVITG